MATVVPYTELLALLRVMEDDEAAADGLVSAMTASERTALAGHLARLGKILAQRCSICDCFQPSMRGLVVVSPFSSARHYECRACRDATRPAS